jgi:hypothetical protein
MANYLYEIDNNNAVKLWDTDNTNEDNAPILLQPQNPNGAAWSSRQEAQSWIEAHLVFIAEQEALQEEEARLAALAEETEAAPTE